MNKVKFSKAEQLIMDEIKENGKVTFDDESKKSALSNLLFKMMIERTDYINIFRFTAYGKQSMAWNDSVDILNGVHSTQIAKPQN